MPKCLGFICLFLLLGSLNAQDDPASAAPPKIAYPSIRDVRFLNDELLDKSVESGIVLGLRGTTAFAHLSSIAEYKAAMVVRAYFQDHGYLKAVVRGRAVPLSTDKSEYDIVVNIVSVGKQYRLGNLNFEHATLFPESQLRDCFAIRRGDVLSRSEITAGLYRMQQLYGANGYINFTPAQNTEFDDANERANLTVTVNESRQFRLRNVEILGLDFVGKQRVLGLMELQSGDIFDSLAWARSYSKISDLAQRNWPPSENKRLDEKNGTADLVIDFRKARMCPAGSPCESEVPVE
jgi:hypothetical protein